MDSEQKKLLTDHYKGLSRDELVRQGKGHLKGNVREKARTSVRYGWIIAWTLIIGALIGIGIFSLWLMFMAKQSGKSFGDMRKQAMSAYTEDQE
jgi:hypothetical protein